MKGALSGKKETEKSADSDRSESQLRRRRVRFGNWRIPLITNHDEIPSRLRTCITSNRITSAQARIEPVLIRLHRVSPDSWHGAQGRLAGLENGAECFATLAEPVELVCQ
jgi:hypothetical protein